MDDSTTNTRSSNQDSSSVTSGGYSWLDDYQSGNYDSLPHDEIFSGYRNWSRTASQDDLYAATYHGYESLGQDRLGDAASDLYGYCQIQGLDLSDLELSSPDYQQWNTQDIARVTSRVYGHSGQDMEQQDKKESGSGGGIPKPLIGLALAGALAFAASRVIGGKSDQEEDGIKGYTPAPASPSDFMDDTMSTTDDTATFDYAASGTYGSDYTSDEMIGDDQTRLGGFSTSSGTSGNDWSVGSSGGRMSGGTADNDWSGSNSRSSSWSGNATGGDITDNMLDDDGGGRQSGSSYNTSG